MARLSRDEYEERLRSIRLLAMDVDGVLTSGSILFIDDSQEGKVFYVRDGSAMYLARLAAVRTAVITGRRSEALARRMRELPVNDVRQGVLDKITACEEIQSDQGIADHQVAYIGDDLIDLPLMEKVGVGIAVNDAHPRVVEVADWVTERRGGEGAVREVVDDIITARGIWDEVMADYRRRQGAGKAIVAEGQAG